MRECHKFWFPFEVESSEMVTKEVCRKDPNSTKDRGYSSDDANSGVMALPGGPVTMGIIFEAFSDTMTEPRTGHQEGRSVFM